MDNKYKRFMPILLRHSDWYSNRCVLHQSLLRKQAWSNKGVVKQNQRSSENCKRFVC